MNREFILNILLLVFINLLIKPFFIFGIDLTVQNRVGEDYGLMPLEVLAGSIFNVPPAPGLMVTTVAVGVFVNWRLSMLKAASSVVVIELPTLGAFPSLKRTFSPGPGV